MGLIVLPFPLTDGTDAFGSEVKANDDAIVAQVNGNLTDVNIAAGANISGAKLGDGTLTGVKLADNTVQGVKIKNDSPLGDGGNRSELYSGSGSNDTGGFPKTNIIAARKQHGGKTIWAYFSIAVADIGTNYIIDNSIDWRKRLIAVLHELTVATTVRNDIPGGTADHTIFAPMLVNGALATGFNGGIFFAEDGQDGSVAGQRCLNLDLVTNLDSIRLFARNTDGALMVRATAHTGPGISVNMKIDCSPHLGTP